MGSHKMKSASEAVLTHTGRFHCFLGIILMLFQAYFFKLGVFLLGEGVDLNMFLTYVITIFFLYFAIYICTHSHTAFQLEC